MLDLITFARPYSKALFEYALEKERLEAWSKQLALLSAIALDPEVYLQIHNPMISMDALKTLFFEIAGEFLDQEIQNFIHVLAYYKRIALLPEISVLYERSKAEHEKILAVDVTTFAPLREEQERTMIEGLKSRLHREIKLNITVDQKILGGAIIKAGDWVMDGSLKGKLDRLHLEMRG